MPKPVSRQKIEYLVRLEAEVVPTGTSRRIHCPACGSATMSITRESDGVVKYICFRASCGVAGGVGDFLYMDNKALETPSRIRVYTKETRLLDPAEERFFARRFGLVDPVYRNYITRSEDGFVFPIRSPDSGRRGVVVRRRPWSGFVTPPLPMATSGPKTLTYPETHTGPLLAWFGERAGPSPVVIVEDALSALCVAQAGMLAVALLGTNLNHERVGEIVRTARDRKVILALDPDATDKAFEHGRNWGMAFDSFRVALLHDDLKDCGDVREELGVKGE